MIPPCTATVLLTLTRKVGEEGTDIKALQVFLNTHGFIITTSGLGAPGNETIYFGLKTQQALARFQESYAADILVPNNLTKGTGFLGNATLKKINSFLVTSSPVVTSKFRRILSLGMSGEDVRALQVLLNAKGFTVTVSGQETNYFGPKTAAALIRFQENYPADILVPNNLTKGTGIVGQATLRKLNELSR